METLRINEDQAFALDEMLRKSSENGYAEYHEPNREAYNKLCITANILKRRGFIKIMAQQGDDLVVILKDDGKTFISCDSFTSQIEEEYERRRTEEVKQKQADANHQLTLKKLGAAKREPYLVAWSIITTITTITLAIIQLWKE